MVLNPAILAVWMHPETTPGERLLCGGAIVIGIRNYKAVTCSSPGMEEQCGN